MLRLGCMPLNRSGRCPRRAFLYFLDIGIALAKPFVGSGCYVVTGKPLIGDVDKFETVSAEFIGQGALQGRTSRDSMNV
jgi:hypothetical protein